MRPFYITCLALSSFFIFSISFAKAQFNQHAFFVPGNAFQENTTIKAISQKENSSSQNNKTALDVPSQKSEDPLEKSINNNIKIKKNRPYVKKLPKVASPKELNETQQEYYIPDTPSPSKYTLDDDLETLPTPITNKPKNTQKQLTALDLYSHKSIDEMLQEQPYPNTSLPKFKQRAALYNTELRGLYRRGNLPNNREQEAALSKASTARYFSVP